MINLRRTEDAALALHRHPALAEAENRFEPRMRLREAAQPTLAGDQ